MARKQGFAACLPLHHPASHVAPGSGKSSGGHSSGTQAPVLFLPPLSLSASSLMAPTLKTWASPQVLSFPWQSCQRGCLTLGTLVTETGMTVASWAVQEAPSLALSSPVPEPRRTCPGPLHPASSWADADWIGYITLLPTVPRVPSRGSVGVREGFGEGSTGPEAPAEDL